MSGLGNQSNNWVPVIEVDSVETAVRPFHCLSGGGPSGFRPIHFKNYLTTEHRDKVLERYTAVVSILAKGEAPVAIAPFLAGASLTALPRRSLSKANCKMPVYILQRTG